MKEYWISFVILGLSINNLIDEVCLDNTKLLLSEVATGFILIIIAIIKYATKNTKSPR